MQKAMNNVSDAMKNRYSLQYIGKSIGGDRNYYKKIGMNFQIFRILNKDEGRNILIESTETLLREINSTPGLRPYLSSFPFTTENLIIHIYVLHPDGKEAFYPEISIFSVSNGKVFFISDTPEMKDKYGYIRKEVESYEDALKIAKTQETTIETTIKL